jgi:hypothetical protein
MTKDVAWVRRYLKIMNVASPQSILQRLSEDWDDATDPTVRGEIEMEKALWLLSAVNNVAHLGVEEEPSTTSPPPQTELLGGRILSLFETQGR